MIQRLILALLLLLPMPALAQNFPPLTGRVVDQADLLPPQQEAELTQRLEAARAGLVAAARGRDRVQPRRP